jgi:cytochrome P450
MWSQPMGKGGSGVSTIDDRPPEVSYNPLLPGPPLSHIEEVDSLRERFRSFRSDLAQGFWVLTGLNDIRGALQDPATFSSRAITPTDPDPQYLLIPEMLDPPTHTVWRQLLAPWFSPRSVAKMEPGVRRRCIELIEPLEGRGGCELNRDFAYRYPTSIFLELMGLPLSDLPQFQRWNDEIHHLSFAEDPDRARSLAAQNAVKAYFADLMRVRRTNPADDLVTAAMNWRIDETPIGVDDLLSMYLLMFQAGMDTVSSQLAYMFWHLAGHPDDRRRLVDDPAVIPRGVEEFLRYYAFVAPSRKVTADVDYGACPMKRGDMVFIPLCGATRDPEAFVEPATFRIDREINNHVAFGAGPHRCLGSHLARQELRVALEEWHARIPEYHLVEGQRIDEHGGMFGLDSLELGWPRTMTAAGGSGPDGP